MIPIVFLLINLFALLATGESIWDLEELIGHPLKYQRKWEEFKIKYGRKFNDNGEELIRRRIFIENMKKIEYHNKRLEQGLEGFELGVNHLTDWSSDDYKRLNGYKPIFSDRKPNALLLSLLKNVSVPNTLDWREKGYVTPIKDQGMCGSCWAFSAVGALEGQHKRVNNKLVSLSEQNLVDCSTSAGNDGCSGGFMDFAFDYVTRNGGIDTEESYPYYAQDEICRFSNRTIGTRSNGFLDLPENDENMLKKAIAFYGPVSVAIDASSDYFQSYSKGIYYDKFCSSDNLNHGVLAVGYGTDGKGNDYWIVKNSWGEDWGDKGYILMSRNRDNNCGIATAASLPTVYKNIL